MVFGAPRGAGRGARTESGASPHTGEARRGKGEVGRRAGPGPSRARPPHTGGTLKRIIKTWSGGRLWVVSFPPLTGEEHSRRLQK
eukprot:5126494-Pyramimonas_sp.AAC.1